MKTLLLFLAIATTAIAQNKKSGIYLTFNDYINNKLSYEINCETEKHTILLNEFLNLSFITMIHDDKKIKLQKDSIYGFIACDKPLARFQNGEYFYLAEQGSVWVFYKEVSVHEGKGSKIGKRYYFSAKGDGKMIEMTIENLKQAFPNNHKFHDMMDLQCNNSNIWEYDTFYKMYKINHLLKDSVKQ